jgi:hypothetical protein
MRFWKCKCGASEAFGSDPPAPCTKCDKCGSDLFGGEPKPHYYVTKYDENSGKPYELCNQCYQRRDRLEKNTDNPNAPLK